MTTRLYYADSFLTDFDATVTEIQELSRADGQSLWRIALDRSAFYPTSGGQPHDTGELIATARSGAELTAEIIGVEEDEQREVWHHTKKPLLPGTPIHGSIHRERRVDHIQQHSGQHLLSAAFVRVCNAPTVSFHLGESASTIDLAIEKLSAATLQQVETLANQIIAEDRPLTCTTVSRQQAEAWLASGELRKLPPRSGEIRIIEIKGEEIADNIPFDRNACGGTHVRSTGQIGGLHLRGIEKVRDGWRVEFVCGLRAMRTARADFQALTEAARQLSVSFKELPEAIAKLQAEGKQNAKQILAQRSELANFRAAQLLRETLLENGLRLVKLQFTPDDTESAAEAKLLASKLTALEEKTAAIFSWRPGNENEPATVILARSTDLNLDCGTILRHALAELNGRGGGSKDMAQGSIPQESLHSALNTLEQKVRAQQ
jgi:alanyl-tRNA synthetase